MRNILVFILLRSIVFALFCCCFVVVWIMMKSIVHKCTESTFPEVKDKRAQEKVTFVTW